MCGLNGCGKSTLGRALAQKIGFHFIDNEELFFTRNAADEPYQNPSRGGKNSDGGSAEARGFRPCGGKRGLRKRDSSAVSIRGADGNAEGNSHGADPKPLLSKIWKQDESGRRAV